LTNRRLLHTSVDKNYCPFAAGLIWGSLAKQAWLKQEDEGLEGLSHTQAGSQMGCGAETREPGDGAYAEYYLRNIFPSVATGR